MTRLILIYLKPIAWFLSIAVLFQCCVVYDRNSVSVEEAINADPIKVKRIKIKMHDGTSLNLIRLDFYGNQLTGILTKPDKQGRMRVDINEDNILKIRLYSDEKSTIATTFLGVITLVLLIFSIMIVIFLTTF